MTDCTPPPAIDATAPQLPAMCSFSWSGFCKGGSIDRYASILAHANQNQWARAIWNPRPGNTSRRIQWRNSHSWRRSWCLSYRQPAPARLPSLSSTLNRYPHRSMSSRCRAKANTDIVPGQGHGLAPVSACPSGRAWCCVNFASALNLLWKKQRDSVRVASRRRPEICAKVAPGKGAVALRPEKCCNRRYPCRSLHFSLPSAAPWRSRLVPARHPSPSQCPQRPPLSWNPLPPRANTESGAGLTSGSDPRPTAPSDRRVAC